MRDDVDRLIDDGLARLEAGDPAGALSIIDAALALEPENPEAHHIRGLALLRGGNRANALAAIEKAIAIEPHEPIFRINAAAILRADKRHAERAAHLRAAVAARPYAIELRELLGEAELDSRNLAAALETAEAALRLDPRSRRAVQFGSASAFGLRRWGALEMFARAWSAIEPDSLDAIRLRITAMFELGRIVEAAELSIELANAHSATAEDWSACARYCLNARRIDDARRAALASLKLEPSNAAALFALSRAALFAGAIDEAENYCRLALEVQPEFIPALAHLADLRDGEIDDAHALRLEHASANPDLPPQDRIAAFYSTGAVRHKSRDFAGAMKAFSAANFLARESHKAEGVVYDPSSGNRDCTEQEKLFARLPECDEVKLAFTPVFVVGMPRSGTTLVESILAAHPDVVGAGELTEFVELKAELLSAARQAKNIDATILGKARAQYLSALSKAGTGEFIIDKQPANYRSIALIRAILPQAKIINVERNPVETGFSIYRRDFGKAWPFATSLDDIGHAYGDYARRIAASSGDPALMTVRLEDLTANIEAGGHVLCEFLGIDWRAEMAEFHKSRRPVMTFSAAKVRTPLQRSAGSAKEQYGALLAPLVAALEAAGVDPETGALSAR